MQAYSFVGGVIFCLVAISVIVAANMARERRPKRPPEETAIDWKREADQLREEAEKLHALVKEKRVPTPPDLANLVPIEPNYLKQIAVAMDVLITEQQKFRTEFSKWIGTMFGDHGPTGYTDMTEEEASIREDAVRLQKL